MGWVYREAGQAEGECSGNLDFGGELTLPFGLLDVCESSCSAELQEVGRGWGLGAPRTQGLLGVHWLHGKTQRYLELQGECGVGP